MYAPSLTSFVYSVKRGEVESCVIMIIGARLGIAFRSTGSGAGRLLNGFLDVVTLSLTTYAALIIEEASRSGISLPVYDKMKSLHLLGFTEKVCKYSANVKALLVLLHAAPTLANLIINMEFTDDININSLYEDSDESDSSENDIYEDVEEEYDYEAVESIPSCILSHLQTIVAFKNFGSSSHEFNLACFLLKHCVQLEDFHVYCIATEIEREEIRVKLCTLPKASTRVEIKCLTLNAFEDFFE